MISPQELAVRQYGTGLPILIIHGWEMAGFVEAHDLEPIFSTTTGYSRLYIDLPGMGDTPAAASDTDLDAMLSRLCSFIDTRILPSRFLVTGSSCGAYIARAVAYRYASVVDGLLLRVPVIEPTNALRDVDPFRPVVANEALMAAIPETERRDIGGIVIQTPEYIESTRRRFRELVKPAVEKAGSGKLDDIRTDPQRYRLTARMHTAQEPFDKPTLIVTGREDAVVGYRDAWSLMPCYPRASFIALDRANHDLPVDGTDLFGALVRDWLWRVEESRRLALQV